MNGLPQFIPPQNTPFAETQPDGKVYIDINWYLFLYNLANNVLPIGSGVPAIPAALIAMSESDAAQADVPQAYRAISNSNALESQDIELARADLAALPQRDNNVQALLQDADPSLSPRDVLSLVQAIVDSTPPSLTQADIAGLTKTSSPTFSSLTVTKGFGCNGSAPQTAVASGGTLNPYAAGTNGFDTAANAQAIHDLLVNIRAALVANGIMS